jgi:alanine dehydrogenase
MSYAVDIANKGWKSACREDNMVRTGLNVCDGKLTCKAVADTFKMKFTPVEDMLK